MDKKDLFHYGCAGAIIVVYLFLVLKGQIPKEGFEYMAGSVIGAVLGVNMANKNGGSNAQTTSTAVPVIPKPSTDV